MINSYKSDSVSTKTSGRIIFIPEIAEAASDLFYIEDCVHGYYKYYKNKNNQWKRKYVVTPPRKMVKDFIGFDEYTKINNEITNNVGSLFGVTFNN